MNRANAWGVMAFVAVMPAVTFAAPPLDGIVEISSGGQHACTLTAAQGIKCWGSNAFGQLGMSGPSRPVPGDVPGLANGVQAVSAGHASTCALTLGGSVKCWGYNHTGQLGDGTMTSRAAPADVSGLSSGVAAISMGETHACALTTGGGVKCWGFNLYGELGDGTENDRLIPVNVIGLSSGVAAIQAHRAHTCAITAAGGLKCWGNNNWGQLGDGTQNNRSTPTDVVGLASGVAAVSLGAAHTCALTTAGGVKCWGNNVSGELGVASTNGQFMSLTAVEPTGLASGAAAVTTGFGFSCALTTSGGVKCWGANYAGQLGNGTTTQPTTPAPPADVSTLTSGVTKISSGDAFTCALLTSGQLRCWGMNDAGQLGDRTTTSPRTTPVAVLNFAFQAIDFPPLGNRDIAATPFTVGATATSSLPVAFTSATPTVCTVSGTSVTLADVGICTLNADQAGDTNFYDAPRVARSFLVTDAAAPATPRLGNISTRGRVLAGANDVLIGGFIIAGSTAKTVLIRARGPSLAAAGVGNSMANPRLRLYQALSLLETNDDWQQGPYADLVQSICLQPSGQLESAILKTLQPGAYTAIVDASGGGTGVAIVEIFEVDRPDTPLTNISTRGHVLTGDDVLIGGFVIQGSGPQTVILRARGPSLAPFGINNPLPNPMLQLLSGGAVIAANDDWGSAHNAAQITASGYAPSNSLESAILVTLNPGAYTAIVTGAGGGTGIGIVEVFRQ